MDIHLCLICIVYEYKIKPNTNYDFLSLKIDLVSW